MKDLEIQELPPLVYQLLLLSTKVFELCICFNLVKCRKGDFHVYIFTSFTGLIEKDLYHEAGLFMTGCLL